MRFPGKNTKERVPLEELIRQHNLWLELSELDTTKLKNYLEEGKIDSKVAKKIEKMAEKYESKSVSVSKVKK
jgi:predicted ribonuclease YlaK